MVKRVFVMFPLFSFLFYYRKKELDLYEMFVSHASDVSILVYIAPANPSNLYTL